MSISIFYEDNDVLVIDKPAGMTVNRAETTKGEMTVQDWVEEKIGIKNQESRIKGKSPTEEREKIDPVEAFYQRGGIVHRLDKETSGILLIAKNPKAFIELQKQFKERIVKKVYVALAHGRVSPAAGEINVPVGRLPWNRERFGILPGGRESVTRYKVINYYQGRVSKVSKESGETLTLLELYPQSGRTHQIRVHLKYIGYPIFSDYLYAGRKTARKDRKILPRVFLHAEKISFQHPQTGEMVSFESTLPPELNQLFATLREVN